MREKIVPLLRKWIRFMRSHEIHGSLRMARERGLSMGQLGCLNFLLRHGPASVGEVSDSLGVTNAAVSQLIDKMVQMELVSREDNPDDRRQKVLKLSEAGSRILKEMEEKRNSFFNSISSSLSEEDVNIIVPALELLMNRITSSGIYDPDVKSHYLHSRHKNIDRKRGRNHRC